MKNLMIQKLMILSLLFSLFTACNTEELSISESNEARPSDMISLDKKYTASDDKGTYSANVRIHSNHQEAEDLFDKQIEIQPIYTLEKTKTPTFDYSKKSVERQIIDPSKSIEIEILDIDLPESAVGFKVQVRADGELWRYSLRASNMRQGIVNVYDGQVLTWNEYTLCGAADLYIENSPIINLDAPGTLAFPWTPADAAFNRVWVEYNKNVDFFEVDFVLRGECVSAESCDWVETDDPVCCGIVNESPVSTRTMQQMSLFAKDELRPWVTEMTTLLITHQEELDKLLLDDPEVIDVMDRILVQNRPLLVNGFANDHTLVEKHNIRPILDLLKLIERKATSPLLAKEASLLQEKVQRMEGKELKAALKSLGSIPAK